MATVEVTCLGLCPSSSCLLIDVQPGPRILLDCPLEPQGLKFFPVAYGSGNVRVNGAASTSGLLHTAQVRQGLWRGGGRSDQFACLSQLGAVDPSTVDYVVITTSHNMLGLPYFTEGSAKFQGTVIATEPTAEIGKLMMMELTQYISTSSFGSSGMSEGGEGEWYKGPGSVEMGPGRDPYTAQQVESCMSRVKRLNFGQSLALSEGYAITPYPSGYCLGSSFWLLSKPQCKVALIGACSMGFPLRTPLPPRFDSLRNVNVAIFGDLLPSDRLVTPAGMSVTQPPPPAWPFRDIGQAIQNTLQKGGNVLMPITLGGTSLDLLEALSMWCPDFGVSGMNAPIYLISPTANSLIGYLEILSEWVQTFDATRREREGRIDSPFVHQSMLQNSRLHIISDVHDLRSSSSSTTTTNMPTQPPTSTYREPCLVLAGHPSLRFGPCLHFLKRWGQKAENALILTDNHWNKTRSDANGCVQSSVTPGYWMPADPSNSFSNYWGCLSTVTVQIPSSVIPMLMEMKVKSVGDVLVARVNCNLQEQDGVKTLKTLRSNMKVENGVKADGDVIFENVIYGSVRPVALVSSLQRRGIEDCEMVSSGKSSKERLTIKIASLQIQVHIDADKCLIETESASSSDSSSAVTDKASLVYDAVMEQIVQV
ncbi:hypothetical protein GUITHDRAFT_161545 [Guillardia theta CCMP2712]|uniref:Beta-Casp domain-containing protein n=1 Tax=Guillardia theta (strain CCMP2712) TaxID=905079 RepID=L1JSU9_GUITC|nr:hypothetical protein GUITHDRAFT_161545 [Guillardia theta CCMP2712]EKX51517.1 hypothetical protein GUITHDRAFT_161545 [Guillardia theta CCMP2712]|eukprot:XP_005838497.1 hypothetical protein GUITHDRAFT_161545 [Guillardia theta CCMP2712]